MHNHRFSILHFFLLAMTILLTVLSGVANGSSIDSSNKYAWSENTGWFNFRASGGNVNVLPDHLEGYVWADNIGWIRLGTHTTGGSHTYANTSATTYGVNRVTDGTLSGYAWSENAGWLNFGATGGNAAIANDGTFSGFVWGDNIGWVKLAGMATDNTAYKVTSAALDLSSPSVSITGAPASVTSTAAFSVTVTFSESVNDFVVGDISVGNGSASSFSGSGTTYTVVISPNGSGNVTLDVAAGVSQDDVGNNNTAAMQVIVTYDATAPTVSITGVPASVTSTTAFNVTFTFSERVTGFTVGDIDVGNGSASNFSGSGTTYTAVISPDGNGNVTLDVAAGVAQDNAGNDNTAATQVTVTYTLPDQDLSIEGNNSLITNGQIQTGAQDSTDFGSLPVNTGNSQLTFTIKNGSRMGVTVTDIKVTDVASPRTSSITFDGLMQRFSWWSILGIKDAIAAGFSDFTVVTRPSMVLANGSANFTVQFTPTAVGLRNGTVVVTFDNGVIYRFRVSGTGTQVIPIGPQSDPQNVPLFTPLGLLTMIFGLWWLGRRRKS